MTNLDSILKTRDFANKSPSSQGHGFSPYNSREVMGPDAMILVFFLFIYLFIPFIFISWRLITLHYCSGFCHTLT